MSSKFYVITGGPGAGKTTLINALQEKGITCIQEVARDIIKEQVKMNGEALPWKNTSLYTRLMHHRSVETYKLAAKNNNGLVFFDRGIPDTLSYAQLIQEEITTEMNADALNYRYNTTVFMLPPWQGIYQTDSERKQTWQEAVQTYEMLKYTYKKYQYEITEIPEATVEGRLSIILKTVGVL